MTMNKSYLKLGLAFALLSTPAFLMPVLFGPEGVGFDYYLRLTKALIFNVLICYFVPCAFAFLPKRLNLSFLITLLAICTLYIAFLSFHWLAYQQLPGTQSIRALMDTDSREAYEFFTLHKASIVNALIPTVLAIVLSNYIYQYAKLYADSRPQKKVCFPALSIVLVLAYFSYDRAAFVFGNPVAFMARASYDVMQDRQAYEKYINMKPAPSGAVLIEEAKKAKVHIVIVGESATSKHMSLYGYERETTPLMRKKRRLSFYQAQDACSDSPLTQPSLEHIMLGGKPLNIGDDALAPANVITTLNEVEYKTFWLSNQSGGEGLVALSSVWEQFVDHSELLSKRDYDMGYDFDEILLPAVERALEDKSESKIIFVHFIGSHPDYKLRYPARYQFWSVDAEVPKTIKRRLASDFRKDVYNEYDNSILYTDFVVASILDLAEAHHVASVSYFSDHGQNVGETTPHIGHSFEALKQGYEVPLLFWIDPEQVDYPNVDMQAFQANLKKPYSIERLQYTLFDIFGLKPKEERRNNSLFSTEFQVKQRVCDQMKS